MILADYSIKKSPKWWFYGLNSHRFAHMPQRFFLLIKNILILLLFITPSCVNAYGEVIDSLHHELRKHSSNNQAKVHIYVALASQYHISYIDSTSFYAEKALGLAQSLHDKFGIAEAYNCLAIASSIKADNAQAELYCKKALAIYVELRDYRGEATCLNNLALIYEAYGRFEEVIKYHKLALTIRLKLNDERLIAASYNNLGNAYLCVGDYKLALDNYIKSMVIRERINDRIGLADSYINLGGILSTVGNYTDAMQYAQKGLNMCKNLQNWLGVVDANINIGGLENDMNNQSKAMFYYRNALSLAFKHGFESSVALCYYNIGNVFAKQHQLDSAYYYHTKSLFFATKYNDLEGIALAGIGLGDIALHRKQYALALKYLEEAARISGEIGSKSIGVESAKLLAQAYTHFKDYQSANKYLNIYASLKDSVNRTELSKELYQNEFKNELAFKQNEITLLEKDKALQEQRENFQILISVSLLVLILAMVFFLVMQYKTNKSICKDRLVIRNQKDILEAQAKRLEELNSIKDKTFSVLSHDIRGPISSLISIIELMDLGLVSNEDFSQLHDKFSQQLKSVNLMLDNLLHWSKGNISGRTDVRLSLVNIVCVVKTNFELYQQIAAEKEVKLISLLDKDSKVFADAIHVDIIIRNLISNAIKFSNKGGEVVVSEEVVDDTRVIYIMDNGVGMSDGFSKQLFADKPVQPQYGTSGEKGIGIGLLLTKEFVERNHGKIAVRTKEGQGTTFIVTLPLS